MNRRFKFEAFLALVSVIGAAITVAWRDWIEIVFRIDPDKGSGTIEWMLVGLMVIAAVGSGTLARAQWEGVSRALGAGQAPESS